MTVCATLRVTNMGKVHVAAGGRAQPCILAMGWAPLVSIRCSLPLLSTNCKLL